MHIACLCLYFINNVELIELLELLLFGLHMHKMASAFINPQDKIHGVYDQIWSYVHFINDPSGLSWRWLRCVKWRTAVFWIIHNSVLGLDFWEWMVLTRAVLSRESGRSRRARGSSETSPAETWCTRGSSWSWMTRRSDNRFPFRSLLTKP